MNSDIFKSAIGSGSPRAVAPANTVNNAGGRAYKRGDRDALAQYAVTGCFGDTFYASAESQLGEILKYVKSDEVDSLFVAKLALYARKTNMKDMPALLCAVLVVRGAVDNEATELFRTIAPSVLDNLKMVANFVKILRSGIVQEAIHGHKATSLPRPARKYVAAWLQNRNPERLLNDATGIDPGLGDIIRIVHPKPKTASQTAVFAYFMGKCDMKESAEVALPQSIKDFEAFKTAKPADRLALIGSINFRRLDALGLTDKEWTAVAKSASWQTIRMNLATFARHGVFKTAGVAEALAAKLRDPGEVVRARALPYQLYAAHVTTAENADVPMILKNALQDAFEASVANTPKMEGTTVVAVDISGSMQSPVTGRQGNKTPSKIMCNQAASLFACALLRVNPNSTRTMVFKDSAQEIILNPRDSVFTNTAKLTGDPGGTNCSSPIRLMIERKIKADTVVILSDYESWRDSVGRTLYGATSPTGLAAAWAEYRHKINPNAKLICIDLAPNSTVQAPDSEKTGVYHVGGFSDAVFEYIASITSAPAGKRSWTDLIEATQIPPPPAHVTDTAPPVRVGVGSLVTIAGGGSGTVVRLDGTSRALVEWLSGMRTWHDIKSLAVALASEVTTTGLDTSQTQT